MRAIRGLLLVSLLGAAGCQQSNSAEVAGLTERVAKLEAAAKKAEEIDAFVRPILLQQKQQQEKREEQEQERCETQRLYENGRAQGQPLLSVPASSGTSACVHSVARAHDIDG